MLGGNIPAASKSIPTGATAAGAGAGSDAGTAAGTAAAGTAAGAVAAGAVAAGSTSAVDVGVGVGVGVDVGVDAQETMQRAQLRRCGRPHDNLNATVNQQGVAPVEVTMISSQVMKWTPSLMTVSDGDEGDPGHGGGSKFTFLCVIVDVWQCSSAHACGAFDGPRERGVYVCVCVCVCVLCTER